MYRGGKPTDATVTWRIFRKLPHIQKTNTQEIISAAIRLKLFKLLCFLHFLTMAGANKTTGHAHGEGMHPSLPSDEQHLVRGVVSCLRELASNRSANVGFDSQPPSDATSSEAGSDTASQPAASQYRRSEK